MRWCVKMEISVDLSNGDIHVGCWRLNMGVSSDHFVSAGLNPINKKSQYIGTVIQSYRKVCWSGEYFYLSATFIYDKLKYINLTHVDANPYDAKATKRLHDEKMVKILKVKPHLVEIYRTVFHYDWGEIYSWQDLKGTNSSIIISWGRSDQLPER